VVGRLQSMGIGRHDRVAIALPNGPEMAVAFLAVTAGAIAAPLNPEYRNDEFEFYLADLKAKALIVPAGTDSSPAMVVARKLNIPVVNLAPLWEAEAGLFSLNDAPCAPHADRGFVKFDEVALVLHTSGTTARPKIVPLTQSNLCASAQNIQMSLELTPRDRCLNVMPLFHIHGLIGGVLSSLAAGGSVVCTQGLRVSSIFEWMGKSQPTWYTATPTMHQAILASVNGNRETMARFPLRFIRSCSAPLPSQVMSELESVFNVPAVEAYGMTEASHQIASNPMPPSARKAGSVGLPAGCEVAIMDKAGNLLSPGQTDEIVIRGPNVTLGYESNPAANENSFTNGWFRTGDLGYLDTDGYLFISGRLKEIINRGGEKISPREIDEVLITHPAVAQVVTFAIPHRTLGEDIGAAIVLRAGVTVTDEEIRAFAAVRLADFKIPRRVMIVDEIPKGPTGKIQRIGLAEKLGMATPDGDMCPPKQGHRLPRTATEKALAGIWTELFRLEMVGIDDDFFLLGGNSLLAVNLIDRIEKVFSRTLPIATLISAATVERLAKILDEIEQSPSCSSLLPLRTGGSQPPLFCVHWNNGTVFFYRDLAKHLGPDHPVYGLQARGVDGKQDPCTKIGDMAANYVREIRSVQPNGPYHLVGRCFGGVVAFEMAQQLHAQGQKTFLIVLDSGMVDPPPATLLPPHARVGNYFRRFVHHWQAGTLTRAALNFVAERLDKVPFMSTWTPEYSYLQRVEAANIKALVDYRPTVYPGPITLLRSSEFNDRKDKDWHLGWSAHAGGGFNYFVVPGAHMSILQEPHVQTLAERLLACLSCAL
jgi:oxalate---CoA ligase